MIKEEKETQDKLCQEDWNDQGREGDPGQTVPGGLEWSRKRRRPRTNCARRIGMIKEEMETQDRLCQEDWNDQGRDGDPGQTVPGGLEWSRKRWRPRTNCARRIGMIKEEKETQDKLAASEWTCKTMQEAGHWATVDHTCC